MILSQLPSELRRLAAQIELTDFDPETRVKLCLDAFGISTAEELHKWTAFMGPRCKHESAHSWIKLTDFYASNPVNVTAHYESNAIVSELVGVN